MKFNIALGNHAGHGINTTRDHTLLIKGGLEEAGHFAHLSVDDVFRDEINIFYDFINPENIAYFRGVTKASHRYGLITTEILTGGFFNNADNEVTRARIAATREVASQAEFLWVMHEPSLPSYRALCGHDRCYYLPLGYAEAAHELRRLPYEARDIDFLFFGYLTPYRKGLLDQLAQRNFVARHVYDVPGFIRNSLIERSKIHLALRQNETWDQPSVGRISYLVTNRCAVIAERTANGAPYENYVVTAEPSNFVASCAEMISNSTYWITADQQAAAFKRDLPMRTIMTRLIEQTFGHS